MRYDFFKTISIIVLLVITLVLSVLFFLSFTGKIGTLKKDYDLLNSSIMNINNSIKTDKYKDWVFDASYKSNVSSNSYNIDYMTFKASDILVPYVNINSNYVTEVNKDMKNIYDREINLFQEGIDKKNVFVNCNYKRFMYGNVLALVVNYKNTYLTGEVNDNYDVYNISLKDGSKLSYKDIYELAGFNSSNIEEKVKSSITKVMKEYLKNMKSLYTGYGDGTYYPDGTDFDTYNNASIDAYLQSIKDETIKYYLDNDKKLNVFVNLSIPYEPFTLLEIITFTLLEIITID